MNVDILRDQILRLQMSGFVILYIKLAIRGFPIA